MDDLSGMPWLKYAPSAPSSQGVPSAPTDGPWAKYAAPAAAPADADTDSIRAMTPAEEAQFAIPATPAPQPKTGIAANAAAGTNEAVTGILGAPVDAANWMLGKIGLPTSATPVMGSQWLKNLEASYGGSPDQIAPANEIERLARGTGAGVAGSVLPGGAVAAADRLGMVAGPALDALKTAVGMPAPQLATAGGIAGAGGTAASDLVPEPYKPLANVVGATVAPLITHMALPSAGGTTLSALKLPSAPANVVDVGGAAVPISSGQLTGDVTQSMLEQMALRGAKGPQAQRVAQQFADAQKAALADANEGVIRGLDPAGAVVAQDPQAAASAVSDAVAQRAADAKSAYQNAYSAFTALPGEIDPGAFLKIGNSVRQRLSAGPEPIVIDDRTTPYASLALDDLDKNIGSARFQNKAAPAVEANDAGAPQGITLADIDQARKRLLSFTRQAQLSGNRGDMRASKGIISAFDAHLQDAINAGLFSGDERALPMLKQARALYSKYASTFTPQGAGDDAGRVISKILGRADGQAATPTEVSNWLFGATGTGQSGASVRVAQRLKTVLGAKSPEWSAIRQGMWMKLTQAPEGMTAWGPQKVSERIFGFLNGAGRPLAHVLFSEDERDLMSRYAGTLKMTVPPPGATNPSGTAAWMSKLGGTAKHLLPLLGMHAGGVPGALAGFAADAALPAVTNRVAAARVARSLYKAPPLSLRAPTVATSIPMALSPPIDRRTPDFRAP